jgi:hypothetical protein
MQAHPSKDTSCTEVFNFKTASAVDSCQARFAVSWQAHLRVSRFGDLSNDKTWSSTFASTTLSAPPGHRAIWDNAYVARLTGESSSLMVYKNSVEEKRMQAHPSNDTSRMGVFNFKMSSDVDLWLARFPTSSQVDFRTFRLDDSSNTPTRPSVSARTTALAPGTHRAS